MRPIVLFALFSTGAILACSSGSGGGATANGGASTSSSSTTTTTSSSAAGSSSSSSGHMNQCVQTTDTGNNNGVGAYCTPGGGQCSKYPLAGACLADLGQSEWFCTRIGCQMNSDCGNNATCVMQTGGSACVPNKCLGGSDAGPG